MLHLLAMGCEYGDVVPIAEILIAKEANVNARAGVLGKPLKWAKKCDDKRLYNLLRRHGAK